MNHAKRSSWLCFLIGLGTKTQFYLYGCIGFSEFVLFLVGPYLLIKDANRLRHNGFMPILLLFFACMIGCWLSGLYNGMSSVPIIKVFAQIYSTFTVIIVFHRLLTTNINGVGYFLLGYALSSIITIWFFHPKADIEIGFLGAQTSEDMVGSVMFWVKKIRECAILPVCLYYFKTPIIYSGLMPLIYAVVAILISPSGRSMALGTIGASGLIFLAQKSQLRMRWLTHHFLLIAMVALASIFTFKAVYKSLALRGTLGETARSKYIHQTQMGGSSLKLLMSGRKEFFLSLKACFDHPIIGLGPHAVDREGYTYDYLSKYGTQEEFLYYLSNVRRTGCCQIPTHSHITSFWLWCGLPGLMLWVYVLWVIFRFFTKFASAVPQWFGYFALNIPTLLWDMFFSPYNWRVLHGVLITALLVAKAIGANKIHLTEEFRIEVQHYA